VCLSFSFVHFLRFVFLGSCCVDQGSTSQQVVDGTDARIIVPFGNYSNVCGTNNIVYFMPLSPLTGRTIYYECRFHRFMGWKINIVPETFCNKYTRLTNSPSQQALITTVLNSTSPPGVMARLTDPNAITRSFFDGNLSFAFVFLPQKTNI
jgi:hypothetical protein